VIKKLIEQNQKETDEWNQKIFYARNILTSLLVLYIQIKTINFFNVRSKKNMDKNVQEVKFFIKIRKFRVE
jgi:hypothetical protein